jgi:hypothetical protein
LARASYNSQVRGLAVLAAITGVVPLGCGSTGRLASEGSGDATAPDSGPDVAFLDASDGSDATSDVGIDVSDNQPDVGPPVPCEAGDYYIRVNYDGGSVVLREGCGFVPDVPSLAPGICAEDCFPSDLCGASDASTLGISFGPTICAWAAGIGVYPIGVQCQGSYWTVGGVKQLLPDGWVRLKSFPDGGVTASGDYTVLSVDGGEMLSGTFCVMRQ